MEAIIFQDIAYQQFQHHGLSSATSLNRNQSGSTSRFFRPLVAHTDSRSFDVPQPSNPDAGLLKSSWQSETVASCSFPVSVLWLPPGSILDIWIQRSSLLSYFHKPGDGAMEVSLWSCSLSLHLAESQFDVTEVNMRMVWSWNQFILDFFTYTLFFRHSLHIEKSAPSTLLSYSSSWLTAFNSTFRLTSSSLRPAGSVESS